MRWPTAQDKNGNDILDHLSRSKLYQSYSVQGDLHWKAQKSHYCKVEAILAR